MPCSPPGDLPNPGIEPRSPALQADSLPSEPPGGAIHTHTHTHTHTLEYYSAIKKNEILPTEVMWVDLENIMLSEINQTETNTIEYHLHVECKN